MSDTYLRKFCQVAPVALSIVRACEGELFSNVKIEHPCLDIGCGDGLFASVVFDEELDVGLDIQHSELQIARESGAYKMLVRANACRIPFPDNHFKLVISNCVFEHIPGFEAAFREINRVLQPGGAYVFTCHSHFYNEYLFYTRLFRHLGLNRVSSWYINAISDVFKHLNCLHPDHWSRLLCEAGFDTVETEYYLSKRAMTYFDLLLPLSIFSFVCRKVLKRWVMTSYRDWSYKLFSTVKGTDDIWTAPTGAGLFIVARKNGENKL